MAALAAATLEADLTEVDVEFVVQHDHVGGVDAVVFRQRADLPAQQAFLSHCLVCRDTLALMLARRALLRLTPELPRHWAEVFVRLQATVLPT